MIWTLFLGTALLSVLLCYGVMRLGLTDAPDEARKTQSAPVPSAGGIGIMAATLVGLLLLLVGYGEFAEAPKVIAPHISLLLYIALAFGLGLADDVSAVPSRIKLLLLGGGAVMAVALWPGEVSLSIPGFGVLPLPAWGSIIGAALWLFVITNAANFMDGSNGLAMGCAGIMALGLGLALLLSQMVSGTLTIELLLGFTLWLFALAVFGFLIWNMQGKLFAGDTGALFAGSLIGVSGLIAIPHIGAWGAACFTLPFLVDVLLTLAWRTRRGLSFGEPHRDHAYQLFSRAGWGHLSIAALWWGMTLIIAVLASVIIGADEPEQTGFWMFAGFTVLLSGLWIVQRLVLFPRLEQDGR